MRCRKSRPKGSPAMSCVLQEQDAQRCVIQQIYTASAHSKTSGYHKISGKKGEKTHRGANIGCCCAVTTAALRRLVCLLCACRQFCHAAGRAALLCEDASAAVCLLLLLAAQEHGLAARCQLTAMAQFAVRRFAVRAGWRAVSASSSQHNLRGPNHYLQGAWSPLQGSISTSPGVALLHMYLFVSHAHCCFTHT